MPDILIRGMEMPIEQPVTLILDPSGRVWLPDVKSSKEYMAKELPPHGDLIDRDALMEIGSDLWVVYDDNGVDEAFGFSNEVILNAPVVVPEEREGEDAPD